MTEDSRVLYVLIVLLLIASLALFYMIVLRHRLRHRASMDDLYQRLTSVLHSFPMNAAGKVLKYRMREEAAERLGLVGAAGIDTAGGLKKQ